MFKKGQSGNPGGRPAVLKDVQEAARQHSATALKTLVAITEDDTFPPQARVAAANAILDRAFGKPAQKNENANTNITIETIDDAELIARGRAARSRIRQASNGAVLPVPAPPDGQPDGVHEQHEPSEGATGG